ncbi:hypothetical protein QY895_06895 [Latilactobacillus sakei]
MVEGFEEETITPETTEETVAVAPETAEVAEDIEQPSRNCC